MYKCNIDSKITKLKNGLEVITVKKDTQLSSFNIGIKVGSLNEGDNEKGIAHFIEHMLFKGTKTKNNEELNNLLENLGGEYNAYTDYTTTVYSITSLEEEIIKGISLIGDMIINPSFPEEEIEKERGVILAEIKSSKDDVEDLSFTRVNEVAFNKSNLRYEVSGTEESVSSFKREDLIKFYKEYYNPDNSLISFVSSLEHEEAIKVIENVFGIWKGTTKEKEKIINEKNIPLKVTTYKGHIEQCTIVYLYTFYGLTKDKELPFKILNHKFGESSNSILFRELRENRGLAYDVYTHMDMTNDVKTLYIYTAVAEENVYEAIEAIDSCIEKMKREEVGFDDNTLSLMKKVHKTAVISTIEDSSELGSYVLNQYLEGQDIKEFIDDMENLNKISTKDIYKIGREILNNPTIHILRPKKEEEGNE
ncbi:M16 family metallopeptidase [Clostridium fallax]|uniref:Predicted Zn-dependent peptidase n=1 Tax=Clostridium fallax TaxID=1533 RepID=A0A1M4YR33_9CLOT|nr:pitrilysin family protein [Clostridium fallax]SHF08309.1 Predicted Zn-dependent peptidase [Clostridium fallax]SQB06219.1 peptidase M16 domain-containing protein [Clostridium fallax]